MTDESTPTQTGLTKACLESNHTMEQVDALVASYVNKHFPPSSQLVDPFFWSRLTTTTLTSLFVPYRDQQRPPCLQVTLFTPTAPSLTRICRCSRQNCITGSSM